MKKHSPLNIVVAALAFAGLSFAVACGGGAALGESCDTEGSVDECESGAVCAKNVADVLQCLKQCQTQADCAAEEECNGLTGSSIKACRPKDTSTGTGGKK